MRKRILLFLVPLMVIGYQTSAQQVIPVMDNLLKKSIDNNMKTNLEQALLLDVIRRQVKNTKEKVEAIEKLQYDYQEFLRQTTSTARLALSDAGIEQEASGQVSTSSGHLSDYTFAKNLSEVYHEQAEPVVKSQMLYDQLIPYDENRSGGTIIFTQLSSFEAYQKARSLNVMALEEMSQQRKIQLANAYQQLAQGKVEKADELRTMLTTDQRFSMTEAERLETIKRMQDYLLGSKQLKLKADQLIRQSVKPSFQKAQVINSFKLEQERKVLSGTTLFQD